MMPVPEDELVARAVERSAWEYGKVGLLIDDSPECSIRVARALYGCDALPKWWSLVRSIGCACTALKKVSELLSDPSFRPLRVFIIVDRYLPPGCGGGSAIAWYEGEDPQGHGELVEAMNGHVSKILKSKQTEKEKEIPPGWTEETACLVRFVTSFPVISTAGTGGAATRRKREPDIPWQMRSVELLQKERREIRQSKRWECLLRFGPEDRARIFKEEESPPSWMDVKVARWQARTWSETLQHLVKMFDNKERMILITGAGASLSTSPMSPGILPTHEIVRRVCSEIISNRPEPRPRPAPPDCVCRSQHPPAGPARTGDPLPAKTPVGRLIQQVVSGKPLEFKLEEVCSPELHEGAMDTFRTFHRLFRRELYKRDYGFAYHHWLLARLPWTAVITTNFDGFHERASAAVARMLSTDEQERLRVLSLGSIASSEPPTLGWDTSGQQQGSAERMGESRLFKPYGSLYSPTGELALGVKEVFDFQGRFEAALRKALSPVWVSGPAHAGAIVVIGQSMRDELVRTVLEKLKGRLARYKLVWVDPNAFARCQLTPASEQTLWETRVRKKMKGRGTGAPPEGLTDDSKQANERACSGPVPATTLEFVYDLWTVYRSKGKT